MPGDKQEREPTGAEIEEAVREKMGAQKPAARPWVPGVGRVVHFHLSEEIVRPAIVIEVHGETCLSLRVFLGRRSDDDHVRPFERGGESIFRSSCSRGTGKGEWEPPKF